MKTRNGFVSNSSSSSFIVRHISTLDKKLKKLDKKTINKLLAFGFKETNITYPTHMDNVPYDDQSIWKPAIDKNGKILWLNYGYWVSINEDEVISFLVKNNIPFIASVHYGHQLWLFHKNDKHVMIFQNYGKQIETYHYDKSWDEIMKEFKTFRMDDQKGWTRIPIKDFINE